MRKIKLCLVSSAGGHLHQTIMLKKWWSRYDRFWVVPEKPYVASLLNGEKTYTAYFPEHRNVLNSFRNFFLALRVLLKEKPDLIFSVGAGVAPPFFLAGKLLGVKLIFMETASFVKWPTLSGRLVHPLVNKFLIQNKTLKKFYSKAEYWGRTI